MRKNALSIFWILLMFIQKKKVINLAYVDNYRAENC